MSHCISPFCLHNKIKTYPPQQKIDIWYVKSPRKITESINSEMNPSLFGPILDYAEYLLWALDKKDDRAGLLLGNCLSVIEFLNNNINIGVKDAN